MSNPQTEITGAISLALREVGFPEEPTDEDCERLASAAMNYIKSPETLALLVREGLALTVQEALREPA